MTKIITLIALMFVSISTFSATTWDSYHKDSVIAKSGLKALEMGTTITANVSAEYISLAAEAISLNRKDIAAWDINNAAYAKILEFKVLTNYVESNTQINLLSPKLNKRLSAVKALQVSCKNNIGLINDAGRLLTPLPGGEAKKHAQSNLDFVNYIKAFVNKKF